MKKVQNLRICVEDPRELLGRTSSGLTRTREENEDEDGSERLQQLFVVARAERYTNLKQRFLPRALVDAEKNLQRSLKG